tara:strand:+ start:2844 stop:3263 length:420 start_codon:yes stop_codon:yes gene_type:complete
MDVETRLKEHCNKQFSKWDIDLAFGEENEEKLVRILKHGKIEVKTERDKWRKTGNIAVELSCFGKKSGLVVTEADWWATILSWKDNVKGVILVPVTNMKKIVKDSVKNGRGVIVMGGDEGASELALVPLEDLINGIQKK